MNSLRLLAVLLPLSLPFTAHADNLRLPADTPPEFQAECASCHLAFPPRLMVAEDWLRVMATLDSHYGDNASLDRNTRQVIEAFLARNAGRATKVGRAGTQTPVAEPPRLTTTTWFRRKHRKVPAATWTHARVKTSANCQACHTRASAGSYREREIVMPNGQNRED